MTNTSITSTAELSAALYKGSIEPTHQPPRFPSAIGRSALSLPSRLRPHLLTTMNEPSNQAKEGPETLKVLEPKEFDITRETLFPTPLPFSDEKENAHKGNSNNQDQRATIDQPPEADRGLARRLIDAHFPVRPGKNSKRTAKVAGLQFNRFKLAQLYTLMRSAQDLNTPLDNYGNTLVHYAALTNDAKLINALNQRGAFFGITNQRGETPLKLATAMGNTEQATLIGSIMEEENTLIGSFFDSDEDTASKPTPAVHYDPQILDNLDAIAAQPCENINRAIDQNGNTILHYAALRPDLDKLEQLLLKGHDTRRLNDQQQSPLDYARAASLQDNMESIEEIDRMLDQLHDPFLED